MEITHLLHHYRNYMTHEYITHEYVTHEYVTYEYVTHEYVTHEYVTYEYYNLSCEELQGGEAVSAKMQAHRVNKVLSIALHKTKSVGSLEQVNTQHI